MNRAHIQADYVIVGGGSAGCVLANRLSVNPAVRVLLVEAGGNGQGFLVSMPAGCGKTTREFGHSWHYHSAPEPMIDNRRMLLPRGRGLGGSSNINGLVFVRGQQADYDSWSNLGALGWGWSDVAPYFQRSESYASGSDSARGRDGPLHVEEVSHRDPTNDAVLQAFAQIGVPRVRDYNGDQQFGSFYYQTTIRNGQRCSVADAYLRPVMNRPNLLVVTDALCRRVVFEGKRATGIEIGVDGETQFIAAHREVILSAGAYHSPKLLMLSGIGPAGHLQSMGIAVRHASCQVGANLQDHFILTMSWRLRAGSYSYNQQLGGMKLLWNVLRYATSKTGPMTIPVAQTGAFLKSDPSLDLPDLQFHCLPVTGDLVADSEGKQGLSPFPGLTLAPNLLRPESRGRLQLADPNPNTTPDIVHNYMQTHADQQLSLRAMRIARELAAAPALASIVESESWPGASCQSDDALLSYARRFGNTGYHPVGSCRMGIDDDAVLDPQLRVRGVIGLRVVDASVMPRLVSGNTNAASIMIGEKGADLILANDH
jgi:choline dehydrogenase